MSLPTVSIIIPVFNGERTIEETIRACLAQQYPHREVIVVDDGSTDRTADIVGDHRDVFYIRQDNAGPASARNLGAAHASGSLLAFTDADCRPQEDWLEKIVEAFDERKVTAVAGSYGIANEEELLAYCIHQEICYRHQHFKSPYVRSFGSYNCAIRKDIFETLGGFEAGYRQASGEDNDLSYKILKAKGRIRFKPDAVVDHFHTDTVKKYLKEQYRHGYWRAKMYFDHPQMLTGDDYTFWKDMLEVVFVFLIFLSVLMFAYAAWDASIVFTLILALFLLEFFFSVLILGDPLHTVYYACVMFARSFVRTTGLCAGATTFIFNKFRKKT